MKDKIERADEIFKAIDESLIKEVLEPKIGETINAHYQTIKSLGLSEENLIKALASVCVVESVRLSSFIAAVLFSIDPDEPFDPRDFIHLVK